MGNIPIVGQNNKPELVTLGMIYYNQIHPDTMMCMMRLMNGTPFGWRPLMHSSANVPRSRNEVVKNFLELHEDSDWLFFVDADMVFEPIQFMALMEAMKENPDAGLIGGNYVKRDGSSIPLIGWLDDEGKPHGPDAMVKRLMENRGNVVEADLVPTGFMLIRRKVLEEMENPWFFVDWPWRDDEDPELRARMWSSDNIFCREVKKRGYKVLGHLGVELGHIGEFVYLPEHFYAQAHNYTAQGQIARIKQYAGEQFGFNSREYWNTLYAAELELGRERNYPLLYEAVTAAVPEGSRVLDMGSGTGTLANLLKDKADVTCADISDAAVKACEDKGLKAFQFDLINDQVTKHGYYDVVIATEVLEHMPDAKATIKKLYSFLKPEGLLIVSVPNNCLPPEEEPEHERTFTEVDLRELLLPFDEKEVLKVDTQPFPKLVGFGVKPSKSKR